MTATSVCSVDADPPEVAFSASTRSSSTPTSRAETIVVHLLSSRQLDLAQLGATSGIDRFADTSLWRRLPTGEPLFTAAAAWIRGRITGTLPAAGGTLFMVEGEEIGGRDTEPDAAAEPPLVYHSRAWHSLGTASQIAV